MSTDRWAFFSVSMFQLYVIRYGDTPETVPAMFLGDFPLLLRLKMTFFQVQAWPRVSASAVPCIDTASAGGQSSAVIIACHDLVLETRSELSPDGSGSHFSHLARHRSPEGPWLLGATNRMLGMLAWFVASAHDTGRYWPFTAPISLLLDLYILA